MMKSVLREALFCHSGCKFGLYFFHELSVECHLTFTFSVCSVSKKQKAVLQHFSNFFPGEKET